MRLNTSHIKTKGLFLGSLVLLCMIVGCLAGCKAQKKITTKNSQNKEIKGQSISSKEHAEIYEILRGGWIPISSNTPNIAPKEIHFGLFRKNDFGLTIGTCENFYAEQYNIAIQQSETVITCNYGIGDCIFIYRNDSLFCINQSEEICYIKYADPNNINIYDLQTINAATKTDSLSICLNGTWELIETRDYLPNRTPSLIVKKGDKLEDQQTYIFFHSKRKYTIYSNKKNIERGTYTILAFKLLSNNSEFYTLQLKSRKTNNIREISFQLDGELLTLKGKPYGYGSNRLAFIYQKRK